MAIFLIIEKKTTEELQVAMDAALAENFTRIVGYEATVDMNNEKKYTVVLDNAPIEDLPAMRILEADTAAALNLLITAEALVVNRMGGYNVVVTMDNVKKYSVAMDNWAVPTP